jgi:fucose 4-O-acetylase-like acetyltransferase
MTTKRIDYIDVAKGIAIFIVVYGHSGVRWIFPYISWIQMTFFFFLGGILFKNAIEKKQSNLSWIYAKCKHLLIPYFVFGSSMYLIFYIIAPDLLPSFGELVIGGVRLQGLYGVYWFITAYLGTTLVFNFISQTNRYVQYLIIIAMNLIGHVLTMTASEPREIFWNLDVVLISTTYFALGYYLKDFLHWFKDYRILIASWMLAAMFVFLQMNDFMDLRMGMKYKQYAHPLLDVLVPLVCIVAMLGAIQLVSKYIDFMKYFGEASLYIMYMHIPLATGFRVLFEYQKEPLTFVVIGMTVPTLIYYLHMYIKKSYKVHKLA